FFGGVAGHAEDRQRGADLRYDMQITLEEAAFGAEREIEVRKLDACAKCGGTGAEPGSHSVNCPVCGGRGQVISSRGFFQVSQTCPRCRGIGQIVEKPCRECDGEGRLERSSRVNLKVPAGTQSGQMFKLRGKGVVHVNGREHGDLLVRVMVEVPTHLNAEQRAKLQEFAELCGEENTPLRKSFFERAKEFFH